MSKKKKRSECKICENECVISWPSEDWLSSKSKLYINTYFLPPRENSVSIIKNNQPLLFREMYIIYCETCIKLINMRSEQNAVLSLLQQIVDL